MNLRSIWVNTPLRHAEITIWSRYHFKLNLLNSHKYLLTLFIWPLPVYLCGVVSQFQSKFVDKKLTENAIMSVSFDGGEPASNSKTLTHGTSDKRDATTEPAAPAPTFKICKNQKYILMHSNAYILMHLHAKQTYEHIIKKQHRNICNYTTV